VLRDLLAPWRRATTWWALTHIATGVVVGTITFSVTIALLATSVGLLIVLPLAVPVVWLLFVSSRILAAVERSRLAALLGVDLDDPVPPLVGRTWWQRWKERARTRERWKEIGHHLLLLPLGVGGFVLTTVAWCGSAALVGLPFYIYALPEESAKFGLFVLDPGLVPVLFALVGVIGIVFLAPWVTVGFGLLDGLTARTLLGPNRKRDLRAQVTQLESSRSAAVDSAEAERKRIERDLHDGAQQRLVSLAMDLGTARERIDTDPESARTLVVEAHEDAKAALRDLRDLVRGFHPAILEDRGLDAALSAVVARSPVPVTLNIDVEPRPPASVESTAYFVISEAITNVATHSRASEAWVTINRRGDRLVVEVRDNGAGGAAPERGTGLRGLHDRVNALDGTMHLLSPPGGPTTLLVELPCAS